MRAEQVIGERFLLLQKAGAGGMGHVYRALDQRTGQAVAIKILSGSEAGDAARLEREASILAGLSHPHIVRHLDQGFTQDGLPFLAMEWLDGEDLQSRLRRGPLSVDDAVALGHCVAEALGFAHGRGIVHRDLKPSNIFLPEGRPDAAKILDFGIAQLSATTRVTRPGVLLGTPGYMAPEQVRGDEQVDPRADVFSLGCVLFEALAGTPAFMGSHLVAILAKILFDDPPRLRDRCADVPHGLDALVRRMIAKTPQDRPIDGRAVASALRALDDVPSHPRESGILSSRPVALTGSEQRAVAVLLIGAPASHEAPAFSCSVTVAFGEDDALRREAQRHGGRLERLIDGTLAVVIDGAGVPTDLCAQAARCAIALGRQADGRRIALALGRGEAAFGPAMGSAIDRAARLNMVRARGADAPETGAIAVDDVAAALLDARFDVRETEGGFVLAGERDLGSFARTLLGKPTPCVGRERELRTLEGLLDACIEESAAQAALVTAPPGVGKSRLAQEMLRKVEERADEVAVWIARADALRAGSAFGMLGQALRSACGIRDAEPLEARREKLLARVSRHIEGARAQRVAEFLGELVGTPFPDDESLPLRAARKDAQLMHDQAHAAFLDFLSAELDASPVLILLEDLHWGDRPTVQFIDRALRDLRDQPLFVLSLARPEVHELFPGLFRERRLQELIMRELGRRASERLARNVLGERADTATIERIVRMSEGNAFYLEELIRATAEGKGEDLPETLLSMVASRLAALDDEARRLLRAASIFGEVFWSGGVAALLGGPGRASALRTRLSDLCERELFLRRPESRFPHDEEHAFRHALLREGAYGMLTDEDRALGHRLAGAWLDEHGEEDALVLAEHFEKGGDGPRAGHHYLRAAQGAHRSGDARTTLAHARRGLALPVPDELRLALLGTICEAVVWQPESACEVLPQADELLALAPRGSGPWCQAAMMKLIATVQSGRNNEFFTLASALGETTAAADAQGPFAFALVCAIHLLDLIGCIRQADPLLEQFAAIARSAEEREPLVVASWHLIAGEREAVAMEDPWRGVAHGRETVRIANTIGHRRYAGVGEVLTAVNLWYLGQFEEAERALAAMDIPDEELGYASSFRGFALSSLCAERGARGEARAWASRLVDAGRSHRRPLDEARGLWALGDVQRRAGDHAAADRTLDEALALLRVVSPLDMPGALATLSALRLAEGRAGEALAAAAEAMVGYRSLGACGFFQGAAVRLIHAECLFATGHRAAAASAIAEARRCLLANAEKIDDVAVRERFLSDVPAHARTLQYAREWLGESD